MEEWEQLNDLFSFHFIWNGLLSLVTNLMFLVLMDINPKILVLISQTSYVLTKLCRLYFAEMFRFHPRDASAIKPSLVLIVTQMVWWKVDVFCQILLTKFHSFRFWLVSGKHGLEICTITTKAFLDLVYGYNDNH